MDHSFCYKVNDVCCCKYIDKKLYSLRKYGYDADKARKIGTPKSSTVTQEHYGVVINELQELHKRKLSEKPTSSSSSRSERKFVCPQNAFHEARRVYYVPLKENENKRLQRNKTRDYVDVRYVKSTESSSSKSIRKCRKEPNTYYDSVDVDPKKRTMQSSSSSRRMSIHSLMLCNQKSYYSRLDETLNEEDTHIESQNRNAENDYVVAKNNKKVQFHDQVQVLEYRSATKKSTRPTASTSRSTLVNRLTDKIKYWFD